MLGFYNYTVILTYLSLLSAGAGIVISLAGEGHPYIGTFFLLICGLCDAFDGKVARMKKDRSEDECKFGIQIDSLSDLVAFGVLPACIGAATLWRSTKLSAVPKMHTGAFFKDAFVPSILFLILILYILAAMIRLAYFNVMEEKRQKTESGVRKKYEGLPVTTASLIFPVVQFLQFLTPWDLTIIYFLVMIIVGFLFLSKISVKKPGFKGIMFMVGLGVLETVILILVLVFYGVSK